MAKLTPAVIVSVLCGVVVIISGFHGAIFYSFLSFILLTVLCLTVLPVCRILFGKGVASFLFFYPSGYLIHGLLLSLCGWIFGITPLIFGIYFAASVIISLFFWRRTSQIANAGIADLHSWNRIDFFLLSLWLLVTVAAVAPVFLHAGMETEQGFAYRAYFNGDVFRNMATAGTLMRSGIPPENPYFAGYPLHYYWFFHILPAFWMTLFPSYRPEFILIQFSLLTALAFVTALFATIKFLTKSRRTLLFCLPLFLLGGSYEGVFILKHLQDKSLPWTEFTNLNVDGILRWLLKLPQVDTLYRPLLYAPQHLLAVTAILILLIVRNSTKEILPRVVSLLMLFISVGFSVIVTAVGVLGFCFMLLIDLLRGKWREIRTEILTGILSGPLFLLLFIKGFNMFDPRHGALMAGVDRNLMAHLPDFFILQWGALFVFGLFGLFFAIQKDSKYALLTIYLLLSIVFLLFVRVDVLGLTEIGLKTGYLIDVALLLFAAMFADRIFTRHARYGKWLILSALVLILPASVTWMMDAYNSQDISNRRFTTYITGEKMEMFQWMKSNLEQNSVVQDYRIRKPDFLGSYISEIPPFANRPMYLGDVILSEIFQTPPEELQRRRKIAAELMNLEDPRHISSLAQKEGIRYFLVWKEDGQAFQQDQARRYFKRIYEAADISLFQTTQEKPRLHHSGGDILMEDYQSGEALLTSTYGANFYPPEPAGGGALPRWMSQNGEISIHSARDQKGTLIFMAQAFGRKRTMILSFEGQPLLRQTIGPGPVKISVPVELRQGTGHLKIESVEGTERAKDTRPLSFRIWNMQFRP